MCTACADALPSAQFAAPACLQHVPGLRIANVDGPAQPVIALATTQGTLGLDGGSLGAPLEKGLQCWVANHLLIVYAAAAAAGGRVGMLGAQPCAELGTAWCHTSGGLLQWHLAPQAAPCWMAQCLGAGAAAEMQQTQYSQALTPAATISTSTVSPLATTSAGRRPSYLGTG